MPFTLFVYLFNLFLPTSSVSRLTRFSSLANSLTLH